MLKKIVVSLIFALLLFNLMLVGCSSLVETSENRGMDNVAMTDSAGGGIFGGLFSNNAPSPSYSMPDIAAEGWEESDVIDILIADPNRKLIRTASLYAESVDFEEAVAQIEGLCQSYGGFIENSDISGGSLVDSYRQMRRASYVFRVPALRYGAFIESVGAVTHLTSKSQNSRDVTDSYYDTESRLRVLKMRQERLERLLELEIDSQSIINYEYSLSDTIYEIERHMGTLRHYDSLVEYATVTLNLSEVLRYAEGFEQEPEPVTIWERISASFKKSTEAIADFFANVVVFVFGNILYVLMWAAAAVAVAMFLRRRGIKLFGASDRIAGSDLGVVPNDVGNTDDVGAGAGEPDGGIDGPEVK